MHDEPPVASSASTASPDAQPAPNELEQPADPNADAAFDALGQPIPARAFSPSLGEEAREYGATKPQERACPWCNAPLAGDAEAHCPQCGAALKPVDDELLVPGVTVSQTEMRAEQEAAARAMAALLEDQQATAGLQPPSDEVRRAMHELERGALAADGQRGSDEPER